ncbi:unnamed protein product [Absidia cylindrospora]
MHVFPSFGLLGSTSQVAVNSKLIERRQQENSTVITFQHYTLDDTRRSNSKGSSKNKRPRIGNACDQCKKKKKGCTGERPCVSCRKKNLPCHYVYDTHVRTPPNDVELAKQPGRNITPSYDTCHTVMTTTPSTTLRPALQFVYNDPASARQQLPPPPPPSPPTPPSQSSNNKSDASFSNLFIQDPCLNYFGYFGGSSVFSAESRLPYPTSAKISCHPSPSQILSHMNLSTRDQHYLLGVYCQNVDTFYPVFGLDHLKEQLNSPTSPSTRATSLNALFFCAVFARAAYLVRNNRASNNLMYGQISTHFLSYAQYTRDTYLDDPSPTCSTVLALLIMANHLECNRLRHQLPVAWKLVGEACTLAVTMGLHAQEPLKMDSTLYQLRLRTFWLTFITDYTIKSIHGRPFLFDEMDISMDDKDIRGKHPDQLQCTENDDDDTQLWIDVFKSTISFCKGAKKIIKFNYSPQQKMDQNHPYYRGYLMTMDHWIYGAAKNDDSIQQHNISADDRSGNEKRQHFQGTAPPADADLTILRKRRLKQLNDLFFYADAMLLHKRYMDDDTYKHESRSVSLEICYRAAGRAIHLASELSIEDLESLSTCPVALYALVMALQLLGCIFSRRNGQQGSMVAEAELLFEKGYHALHQLPIFQNPQSMMYDTLYRLWDFYDEYCATKGQQHLSGEMLLRKPIINAWSCDFDHPFNAFLDSGGVPSFMNQLLSASTPTTSSSMVTESKHSQETVESDYQHIQHAQQSKDNHGHLNSIIPTLGAKLFQQSDNYLNHQGQQNSLCNYPSSASSVFSASSPSSSSLSSAATTALASEKAPIGYEGLAPDKLFPTFELSELMDLHQQGLWAM